MRRREFLSVLGGAVAVAGPIAAHAQQRPMPVVGFLNSASPAAFAHLVAAFREGLKETGHVEGRNVAIEYRWAEGLYERLPSLAHDLIGRQVTVLVATGGEEVAQAAKARTNTIPIVFTIGSDPVQAGLVASFNRPGGNITGATLISKELGAKQFDLVHTMVPNAHAIAVLTYALGAGAESFATDIRAAAQTRGQEVNVASVNSAGELDRAFATIIERQAGAILIDSDAFFNNLRNHLVSLAAKYKIPAIYAWREMAAVGGLMSYGPSLAEVYRQAGIYTGQILKGAKPNDLPVVQPTKFELVINLKTARALGLTVPSTLLVRADEVIE